MEACGCEAESTDKNRRDLIHKKNRNKTAEKTNKQYKIRAN